MAAEQKDDNVWFFMGKYHATGEGEEVDLEVIDLYKQHKKKGTDKQTFLREAAKIQGVYVPAFYEIDAL